MHLDMGLVIQFLNLVLVVFGYGLFSWTMVSNKFFSGVIRIQKERGHAVVKTGPYRYVRHPVYAGLITAVIATPVLLGSLWALLPEAITAVIFIFRTTLEDRTLLQELDGYGTYTQQVRYRFVPSRW